jgi:AcrR family transcriptional regulator
MPSILTSSNPTADRLLETALDLFAERGYQGTSMDDLAESVGILKGSLYHYISGKHDLLSAILVRNSRQHAAFALRVNQAEKRGLEALRYFIKCYAEENLKDIRSNTILVRDWSSLPEREAAFFVELTRQQVDYIKEVISQAQQDGEVAGHHRPGLAATAVWGMLVWTSWWYQPGTSSMTPEAIGRSYADLAVNGLREPRGSQVPQNG